MREDAKSENDITLMEVLVADFRTDNLYWSKEGVTFQASDLPGGYYLGPDERLFQLCLELRAISWKIHRLRVRALRDPDSSELTELDDRNSRNHEYLGFCELSKPLFESRIMRLAELRAQTLHGLAAKAKLLDSEYFGVPSDEEDASTKLMRSVLGDIRDLMGLDQ